MCHLVEASITKVLNENDNAATLLESQTGLLQSKLTYVMKCRLVDYYKGEEIIRNEERNATKETQIIAD